MSGGSATPRATKLALSATVAATVAAMVVFAGAARDGELEPRLAGWFLLLFGALFVVRVAGQLVVVLRAPTWLPPMEQWILLPYRLLLPTSSFSSP